VVVEERIIEFKLTLFIVIKARMLPI